jgi:DNA-binding beta-propeller fold protein YncE
MGPAGGSNRGFRRHLAGAGAMAGVMARPASTPDQGCGNPSDTVMAVRAATGTVERVIKVGLGAFPSAIAITPSGKTVYVASVATCTSVQPPGDVISSAGVRVPSA